MIAAFLRPAALSLALALAAGAAHAADLTLTFEGMTSPKGAVMVALFDSESAYAGGLPPVAARRLPVGPDAATVVLTGLKPGRYAIKAFHDLDDDGKMAANPFGMPTEPFAFSNNAVVNGGPPAWSAAVFDLAEPGATQTIRID